MGAHVVPSYDGLNLHAAIAPIEKDTISEATCDSRTPSKASANGKTITILIATWLAMHLHLNVGSSRTSNSQFTVFTIALDILIAAIVFLIAEYLSFAVLRGEMRRLQYSIENLCTAYGRASVDDFDNFLCEEKTLLLPGLRETSGVRTRLVATGIATIAGWIIAVELPIKETLPSMAYKWQSHLIDSLPSYLLLLLVLTITLEAWGEEILGDYMDSVWTTELVQSTADERHSIWELWFYKIRASQLAALPWHPVFDELREIEKEPLLRQAYFDAGGDLIDGFGCELAYGE